MDPVVDRVGGGVQPGLGHDAVDPLTSPPPQEGKGQRDEEDLPGDGRPSPTPGPPAGQLDAGRGLLDDDLQVGNPSGQVVGHDVGGVAPPGQQDDPALGGRSRVTHRSGIQEASPERAWSRSRLLAMATAASWDRTPSLRRVERMWERTVVSETTNWSAMSWAAHPSVRK